MVISHFLPMLLLIASLFFLPASHAVYFYYCNGSGYVYGNITSVDISPNPVELNDDPTIKFFGFANNSSSHIYQGKIVVFIESWKPWSDGNRTLVTKEFDEHDGVIESGKNFKLSIRVPSSDANLGEVSVTATLIDELGVYDVKPGPQERLCFHMYLPSKYHEILPSS